MSDDVLYIDHHGDDGSVTEYDKQGSYDDNETEAALNNETYPEQQSQTENTIENTEGIEQNEIENPTVEQDTPEPQNTDNDTDEHENEPDPFDDIQSKLMGYPLPTPEIGNMSPPPPPQTKENNEGI